MTTNFIYTKSLEKTKISIYFFFNNNQKSLGLTWSTNTETGNFLGKWSQEGHAIWPTHQPSGLLKKNI